MENRHKYAKAALFYSVGNVFNRAISLLLLPVFTRLLSTSSYGIVSTYNSWVSIATVIIGLQLSMTLRNATTDYKGNLSQYISSINTFIIGSFAFFGAIAVTARYLFFKDVPLLLVCFCCIHALMTSIINVELQKQMMLVEYVKRTLLLALPSLIAAVFGILVIYFFPSTDYWGRITTNVVVFCAFGLVYLIGYCVKGKVYYNKEIWKYSFSLAAPLVFHGLAMVILSGFDKTMLTMLRSAGETGIYSVAATIGTAVLVITSSAESVWVPFFTKKMNDGEKKTVNDIGKKYLYVVTVFCIISMLCLPEVLKVFSDKSYWGGVIIIPPIVLAAFIRVLYSLSADVEYYYKSTTSIAINTLIAAFLNILLNALFIPKYGVMAAAYTTVASYGVSFFIHYLTARKLDKDLFEFKMYFFPIIAAFAGTITTSSLISACFIRWSIALTLCVGVLIFLFKDKSMKILIRGKENVH